MKTDGSSKIKLLSLMIVIAVMMIAGYAYYVYYTYQSIEVVVKDTASIEYGSPNYNLNDIVKKIDGEIVGVKKVIDTSSVGQQEMIVEVKKGPVVKEVPFTVDVVDTVAPEIYVKEESITITEGDDYNLVDNVAYVFDQVSGSIGYLDNVSDESNTYYSFNYNEDEDITAVGTHDITVTAKDEFGNISSEVFKLEVVEAPEPEPVYVAQTQQAYYNLPANPAGGDLVSIAYSLVGSPYVYGTAGPYTFDCSGFVSYVYSQVGINISRSSSAQYYEGYGVSYADAQPGDILSWGYADGAPSHSALYVGNGLMIHAANPSTGVIVSDVAAWTRGSGSWVIAVRRIQ